MRLLLLLIPFFMVCTSAYADPATAIAVGNFILAGAGISVGSVAVIAAVGYVAIAAIGVGLSAAAGSLAPGAPAVDPSRTKQATEIKEGPVIYAWGRCKIGGRFFFKDSSGFDIYRGLMQCQGEIDAYERFFIGNREVIVDTQDSGKVRSFPWSRTDGTTYAFIETKLGDGTETAYPDLISDFPDRWTSDHRVRGIAQMFVKLVSPGVTNSLYQRLFGDQTVRTDYSAIGRFRLVYDPRLAPEIDRNTSTGWENSSYYAWTENGILNAADAFLLQDEFTYSDIDWDDIVLEANKADASVATKDGTEARSRMWGSLETETESRANILKSILESIDGYVYENYETGKYSIRLDEDNPASEITFTEADHIISYELSPKEGPVRNNILRLSYYSEELDFDLGEVGLVDDSDSPLSWSQYDDEIARYGESEFEVGLPFCPSASQAQRKARRMFAQDRARNGVAVLNMSGMAAWGRRIITLDLDALGSIKVRVVDVRVDDAQKEVEIAFVEEPELSVWNPVTDEATPPDQIESLVSSGDLDTPSAPTEAAIVQYQDNARELRLKFDGSVSGADLSEAIYRRFDGSGNPTQFFSMNEVGLTFAYASQSEDLDGETVEFRVRVYDNAADEISNFSSVFSTAVSEDNTTPSTPSPSGSFNQQSDSYSFNITIPDELSIVAIEIDETDFGNGTQTPKAKPGDTFTISDNGLPLSFGSYDITWTFITSDGTRSATHTETYVRS